jgi:excisionase family DNA binding protein
MFLAIIAIVSAMFDVMELPKLLTAAEVAEILGKHPRTVLVLAERGELTAVRLGHRTVRFHPADVEAYIDAHRMAVAP